MSTAGRGEAASSRSSCITRAMSSSFDIFSRSAFVEDVSLVPARTRFAGAAAGPSDLRLVPGISGRDEEGSGSRVEGISRL